MSKRWWIPLAIIVVAVVIFFVWWKPKTDETRIEPLTIAIGFRPTVVVDLAFLEAVESGEFKQAGINVELRPYGRADLLFAALSSNEIQGSTGAPIEPLLSMATKSEYLYRGYIVWYFDSTNPYDGFVVMKDSPAHNLDELSGTTVGSHPSKQVKYFVTQMLPHATIQEYNPATPLLAVQSGDQAAAYVLEPVISQAVTSGGYRLLEKCSISRRIFGNQRVPAALSLLSAKWIEAHPAGAERFVEIARRVQQKELAHPNRSAKIALLAARGENHGLPRS